MKVYVVGYYDNYESYNVLCVFSSEDKANTFIEACKNKFYRECSIVLYDYRDLDLHCDEWDLDEFEDIVLSKKVEK